MSTKNTDSDYERADLTNEQVIMELFNAENISDHTLACGPDYFAVNRALDNYSYWRKVVEARGLISQYELYRDANRPASYNIEAPKIVVKDNDARWTGLNFSFTDDKLDNGDPLY